MGKCPHLIRGMLGIESRASNTVGKSSTPEQWRQHGVQPPGHGRDCPSPELAQQPVRGPKCFLCFVFCVFVYLFFKDLPHLYRKRYPDSLKSLTLEVTEGKAAMHARMRAHASKETRVKERWIKLKLVNKIVVGLGLTLVTLWTQRQVYGNCLSP